jgi:hypothetical protein
MPSAIRLRAGLDTGSRGFWQVESLAATLLAVVICLRRFSPPSQDLRCPDELGCPSSSATQFACPSTPPQPAYALTQKATLC